VRVLSDLLWYYGREQKCNKLSDTMWASKIMSVHFFRKTEKEETEKANKK